MAKEAPTFSVTIDDSGGTGRDISEDVNDFDFATPRGAQEATGVDKSAMERILLLADYSATFRGTFDDASNKAHDVFKTVPSASVTRTVALVASGQTLSLEALLLDYALARAPTGELTWTVPAALQSGTAPSWS